MAAGNQEEKTPKETKIYSAEAEQEKSPETPPPPLEAKQPPAKVEIELPPPSPPPPPPAPPPPPPPPVQPTGFSIIAQPIKTVASLFYRKTLRAVVVRLGKTTVGRAVKRVFEEGIKKLVKEGVKKVGAKVAAKLGIQAAIAAVGAATTEVSAGVSAVVAFIANAAIEVGAKIIGKVKSFVKKLVETPETLVATGLGLGALGFRAPRPFNIGLWGAGAALAGAGLIMAAPAIIVGASAAIGGFFASLAALPAVLFAGLTALTAGTVIVIGTLTIIGLLAATTFYQVMTTSSAFILPHAPEEFPVGPVRSAYIDVFKTISPKTQFSNDELPATITYSLTVSAKQGKLVNVRVEDKTTVTKQTNPPSVPPRSWQVPEITTSWTQTYTLVLEKEKFEDSFIGNFVTVTADVEGGPQGEQAFTSAGVQVGSPPTGCFAFTGPWTIEEKAIETQAISTLLSSSVYQTRLCAGSQISLERVRSDPGYGGFVPGPGRIIIYNRGLGSFSNTFYTLSHESGHIFARRNSGIIEDFYRTVNPPIGERYLCSYPYGQTASEDFAETIAVYVTYKIMTYRRCGGRIDMPAEYPKHFNFAKDKIFGGFQY